ncbi:hypothetical protein BTM20_00420 [Clostridium chauvoei]|nr:hypothetical protein BTM20_00420 [Clostridium chauvoei]
MALSGFIGIELMRELLFNILITNNIFGSQNQNTLVLIYSLILFTLIFLIIGREFSFINNLLFIKKYGF